MLDTDTGERHRCCFLLRKVSQMWMDLETVIQSEVSQKEKNKYCVLTHVGGI